MTRLRTQAGVPARYGLAVALVAVACSSPPEPVPEPVPLTSFSAKAQEALCDWAVRCRHVPDRPTCRRFLDPKFYDSRRARDGASAGRMIYDAVAAGACLAATAEAFCLETPFSAPPCDRILGGLVPEGGACTANAECEGRARCEDTACGVQCCLGTCGAPVPEQTPPEPSPIGGSCRTHSDCVIEGYCETDGTCTALPDEPGERCLFGCARGDLYCDLDALACRLHAQLGEPCDPEGQDAPRCDGAWAICRDGVCAPRPGPGEPCTVDPDPCVPTSYCDGGACTPRGEPGADCADDDHCTWQCDEDAGVCVPYATCTTEPGDALTRSRAPARHRPPLRSLGLRSPRGVR